EQNPEKATAGQQIRETRIETESSEENHEQLVTHDEIERNLRAGDQEVHPRDKGSHQAARHGFGNVVVAQKRDATRQERTDKKDDYTARYGRKCWNLHA